MGSADSVMLDGPSAEESWPLRAAEALLTDETPWGLGPNERGPNQTVQFCRLAACVNAHKRGRTYTWAYSLLDRVDAGAAYEEYSTQELLDVLFVACRTDRFRSGTLKAEEPRLRLLLREIVRRVRSDSPPTFLVESLG